MINIDENQLKLLLVKKKKNIEKSKLEGIGEVISSISLGITLALSDFNHVTMMKPIYFAIGAWLITIFIFIYGIKELTQNFKDRYPVEQLYNDIINLDSEKEHLFNLIVVRNHYNKGKYLVFKNVRWKCWHFPNYHCLNEEVDIDKEKENIKIRLQRDLEIHGNIDLKYIGNERSNKYSFGDCVNKNYNFYYFEVTDIMLECMRKNTFKCNGKKYSWKTLDQIYSDKNIVKKNKDVLDFVRRICDIN